MQVSVIGKGSFNSKNEILAYQLGKRLAENNINVVCGGKGGVMSAVCKGAKENGGITVGIIPEYDKECANDYVDIVIPSGMGSGRNILVVSSGDLVIAVGGEEGTLSEIALALKLGKTVICLNSWDIPELKTIKVNTVEEAVELTLNFLSEIE